MSTSGQILDRQTCSLTEADCIRVLPDKLSGKTTDQLELTACLDHLRGAVDASGVNMNVLPFDGTLRFVGRGHERGRPPVPRINMRPLVYSRTMATKREVTRCAIWARVSTDDQESANQLAELRSWAERRELEVAAEYVLDGASAWTGKHREQLHQALDDARLGRYDVLLVWALDRLSREGIEATLSAMRKFAYRGVAVWSLRESWTETSDPHVRELITAIMAWVAQMESQRRSERTRAGLARRKAEGLPVGRQPGARDTRPRKRSGYVARWEREQSGRQVNCR